MRLPSRHTLRWLVPVLVVITPRRVEEESEAGSSAVGTG